MHANRDLRGGMLRYAATHKSRSCAHDGGDGIALRRFGEQVLGKVIGDFTGEIHDNLEEAPELG